MGRGRGRCRALGAWGWGRGFKKKEESRAHLRAAMRSSSLPESADPPTKQIVASADARAMAETPKPCCRRSHIGIMMSNADRTRPQHSAKVRLRHTARPSERAPTRACRGGTWAVGGGSKSPPSPASVGLSTAAVYPPSEGTAAAPGTPAPLAPTPSTPEISAAPALTPEISAGGAAAVAWGAGRAGGAPRSPPAALLPPVVSLESLPSESGAPAPADTNSAVDSAKANPALAA